MMDEHTKKEEIRLNTSYEIGRFVYLPGRRVFPIYIKVSPEGLYRPGVLADILQVFTSKKVPIVHLDISRPNGSTPIDIIVFADLTGREHLIDDIVRDIKLVKLVDYVRYNTPEFNGLASCNNCYFLTLMRERVVVFRKTLYKIFAKRLREELGSGYTAWLYQLGIALGKSAYKSNKELIGEDFEKLLKIGSVMFEQVGFGKVKIVEADALKGKVVIRISDSFECELYKGQTNEPSSFLIKGMLKGYFDELIKRDVKIVETKCIAKGDPYCEFVIE